MTDSTGRLSPAASKSHTRNANLVRISEVERSAAVSIGEAVSPTYCIDWVQGAEQLPA